MRVAEALETVRLSGYDARKPAQLSGGQRQRVALARAIVNHPRVLLLDEPLGALDLKLRQEMQIELKRIQQEVGITFVYVTHDQEEALTMSDRIAVFNHGRVEQVGTPVEVYEHPVSEFVAGFVGVSNVLERGGRRFTVQAGEDPHPRARRCAVRPGDRDGARRRPRGRLRRLGDAVRRRPRRGRDADGRQSEHRGPGRPVDEQGRRVLLAWRPENTFTIDAVGQGGSGMRSLSRRAR